MARVRRARGIRAKPDLTKSPPRVLPRRIAQFIKAGALSVIGQPLIGRTYDNVEMVAGSGFAPSISANVGSVGEGVVQRDSVTFRRYFRSGTTSKQELVVHYRGQSIHGFLDPDGPELPYDLIAQDLVQVRFDTALDSWAFFGWWGRETVADETTYTGLGFRTDRTDKTWKAFVIERNPLTTLHDEDSGISSGDTAVDSVTRRLTIVLYGKEHKAEWYIDGDLVSTYTPSTIPGQMGTSTLPVFGYSFITDAGAATDFTPEFRIYGGSNTHLLSLVSN